jgi:hypothetical protein
MTRSKSADGVDLAEKELRSLQHQRLIRSTLIINMLLTLEALDLVPEDDDLFDWFCMSLTAYWKKKYE